MCVYSYMMYVYACIHIHMYIYIYIYIYILLDSSASKLVEVPAPGGPARLGARAAEVFNNITGP